MRDLASIYRHMLIVDDIRGMRMVLRCLLRSFGIDQISEAGNGGEGLRMLRTHKIDLVITDLNMAPIDGIEMTRQIRAPNSGFDPSLPIMMVSGHKDANSIRSAVEAGVTDFLAKPVAPSALLRRLQLTVENPKRTVQTPTYLGPDRRRRNMWVRQDRRALTSPTTQIDI